MNALLKRLIEESNGLVDSRTSSYYESPKLYIFTEETATRFAELIVMECGVALSPMLRDMVSRGQAYDMIKQHFGVEA